MTFRQCVVLGALMLCVGDVLAEGSITARKGIVDGATFYGALKFQNLVVGAEGSAGPEMLLGPPDLAGAAAIDFSMDAQCGTSESNAWGASNYVKLEYSPHDGVLIVELYLRAPIPGQAKYCLSYSVGTLACPPGQKSYVQFDVANMGAGTTVCLTSTGYAEGESLNNANLLGDLNPTGLGQWYIDGIDLSNPFRIDGMLALDGPLDVANMVMIRLGCVPDVAPPTQECLAPLACGDHFTIFHGQRLGISPPGVLQNDKDPQGLPLIAEVVEGTSKGSLTLYPDGSVTYVPDDGVIGPACGEDQTDFFTYRVQNSCGKFSEPAVASITIRPNFRNAKRSILAGLKTMAYDANIEKAAEYIQKSLTSSYWSDDVWLTKDGEKVFDYERSAVYYLSKVRSAEACQYAQDLTAIDRKLVLAALCAVPCGNGRDGEGCSECEGKVTSLTLRNNGPTASITVIMKDGTRVFGPERVVTGEAFTFVGKDKYGTLGTEIELFVDAVPNTTIHTSCSQPIGPGLVRGNFTVVAGTSLRGGALCPLTADLDGGQCANCEGGVKTLVLRYLGPSSTAIKVVAKSGVVFQEIVAPGATFTVTGTESDGKLGTNIDLCEADVKTTSIHTSCSQPIGPGLVKGNFEVVSGTSVKGGPLCPLTPVDGGSIPCGDCYGGVTTLTLRYTGPVTAHIAVNGDCGVTLYTGTVARNGEFTFSGCDKYGKLGTEICVYVNGALNACIHTSCSQPIGPGLVKGNFLVVSGMSLKHGPLCPIAPVPPVEPPDPDETCDPCRSNEDHEIIPGYTERCKYYLAKALKALAEADAERECDKAIYKYKRAWEYAMAAIDKYYAKQDLGASTNLTIPTEVVLDQNYPNPFNPTTMINYAVPFDAAVEIAVYDMLGRKVAQLVERRLTSGVYSTSFDATPLSSGIYLYRLMARSDNGQTVVKCQKMMLMK